MAIQSTRLPGWLQQGTDVCTNLASQTISLIQEEELSMHRFVVLAVLLSIALSPQLGWAKRYKVDPDHTSVTFRVRHLFTAVKGRFDRFDGEIDFDPAKPQDSKVSGSIDVASINTNVAERDKHLRSKDFFDVEQFPKMAFVSTGVNDLDASKKAGKMQAKLTIHGIEKPVVLEVSYLGELKDPWGNVKAGFTAQTTINRKDFGLTWNKALETGGALVGDDVQIEIDAEGQAVE
jgi:polyisoprenoid-binding protein YceI